MSDWQNVKKEWVTLKNGIDLNINGQGIVRLSNAGFPLGANGLKVSDGITLAAATVAGKEDNGQEYVDYKFRMLSKTYIPGWELDFREPDVLQSALSMFTTKLFRNHDTVIENSIGKSFNPYWSDTGSDTGAKPGIDSTYRIYKAFGQDIIDRLNVNVLDSTSVGIRFLWKKSHPGMKLWDFLDNLGNEIDGQIVRFIVTKILSIPEASIVWLGADENAKRLSAFAGNQNQEEIINSQGENMDKVEELSTKLSEKTTELTELNKKHSDLQTENKNLKAENEKLKPLATLGEAQQKSFREDAEKFYRLAYEKPKDEMLKILQSGDLKTVEIMAADFKERAEKLHPAKCAICGSHFTRQSSGAETENGDGKNTNPEIDPKDYE